MCGIAAVFLKDRLQAEDAVRAMNRAQVHRGPDDDGRQAIDVPGGTLALGHQRLSILDLSPAGHQPMRNPETGDWVTYNGEIYNYPELRRELESAGVAFRSRCDTEVILHGFARWGESCFDRLHGMFAIAIYHKDSQRLILARDPLGMKPLYYAISAEGLVVASELRALRASGLVSDEIDRRALAGLLAYGAVPCPLTMFRHVRLLEPGTFGWYDVSSAPGVERSLQTRRYWDFPSPKAISSREEAVEGVRDRLETAARRHLLSDVPVGIFLSSGLDSTAVATLCARGEPDALNTFTVNLADHPEIDESRVAEETARTLGARHENVWLSDSDLRASAGHWLECLDQPSVDGLNTHIVSEAVKDRGMKVALSGLGGDEVFGGYSGFHEVPRLVRWARRGRCVPGPARGKIAELACLRKSKAQRRKANELARTRPTLRSICLRRRRLFSDFEMETLGFSRAELDLNEDFLPPETNPDRALDGLSPEAAVGVLEARFYMGNMLLRDSDVFGMAHALEIRVPFLDRGIVDYVFSLPGKWRVRDNGTNKPLLVAALGERLRPEIVSLRKRGFSLPYSSWMSGPLCEQFESLLDATRSSGLVNESAVSQVRDDFLADAEGPTWSRAWLLGVLGAWTNHQRSQQVRSRV